jgi:hypothetical protein
LVEAGRVAERKRRKSLDLEPVFLIRNEEVRGSIPLGSTTASPDTVAIICLLHVSLPDEFGATRPPTRPPVRADSGRGPLAGDFPQLAGARAGRAACGAAKPGAETRATGCGIGGDRAGAPGYSITSVAATCSVKGTVRPSDFAVFRLITSSNLDGCMTGRSAGLSPLRMRPT